MINKYAKYSRAALRALEVGLELNSALAIRAIVLSRPLARLKSM